MQNRTKDLIIGAAYLLGASGTGLGAGILEAYNFASYDRTLPAEQAVTLSIADVANRGDKESLSKGDLQTLADRLRSETETITLHAKSRERTLRYWALRDEAERIDLLAAIYTPTSPEERRYVQEKLHEAINNIHDATTSDRNALGAFFLLFGVACGVGCLILTTASIYRIRNALQRAEEQEKKYKRAA